MIPAGLIFDNSIAYLDHLAPFCALLGWPLILCDPDLCDKAKEFYPDLTVLEAKPVGIGRWVEQNFTHLVTCTPRPLLKAALAGCPLYQTDSSGHFGIHTFWLPHGHSDKGEISNFYEGLREEEVVLLYGQKMVDLFTRLKIPLRYRRVGHFRWNYYQKVRSFYDTLSLGFHFPKNQKTILYAPTWEDIENNCTLWNAFPILSEQLPDDLNLLVKPHPNTIARSGPQLERLIGKTERSNLQFLLDTPPILALLERCDAYLGDRSSIGYDFLLFDKPLFFLDPHDHPQGRDLLRCGQSVSPDTIFQLFRNPDPFSERRREMISYTFDLNRPLSKSALIGEINFKFSKKN